MIMKKIEEMDEAELPVFKKKLKKLEAFRGRGTEMISVYIPPATDRSAVTTQLTNEVSQAGNIKSPQTRKNVQGALRKILGFLKNIDFDIPEKGLAVFCGNVSEKEGISDIRLFIVRPIIELRTKLYWCDEEFHLAPLKEMVAPTDIYGLVVLDKSEATIAVLQGKKYDILGKFTSGISGKHHAGGQSASRFERLHEEAAQEFYKRVSEHVNQYFLPYLEKLKGIVVGGPGATKNFFLEKEAVDYRLRKKVIGTLDTSYTDESGIREMIQRSEQLLKDTALMKERALINKFLEEIAKGGMAIFGEEEVLETLKFGKVETVLVSEGIDWVVVKLHCNACGQDVEKVVKNPLSYNSNAEKCEKCKVQSEVMEEIDYIDWLMEKAFNTGAKTKVISTETAEGEQFFKGFGGIGALLRFK